MSLEGYLSRGLAIGGIFLMCSGINEVAFEKINPVEYAITYGLGLGIVAAGKKKLEAFEKNYEPAENSYFYR